MCAGEGGPGPRITPGACQLIFKVARSLQKRVNVSIFRLFGFVAFLFRKNTIRERGSTALKNVDTVETVYTIQTALHCLSISMHACVYC